MEKYQDESCSECPETNFGLGIFEIRQNFEILEIGHKRTHGHHTERICRSALKRRRD